MPFNGWTVLLVLCLAVLACLGVVWCVERLNYRLALLDKKIDDGLTAEQTARSTEMSDAIKKEAQARSGVHQTVMGVVHALSDRVAALERKA